MGRLPNQLLHHLELFQLPMQGLPVTLALSLPRGGHLRQRLERRPLKYNKLTALCFMFLTSQFE